MMPERGPSRWRVANRRRLIVRPLILATYLNSYAAFSALGGYQWGQSGKTRYASGLAGTDRVVWHPRYAYWEPYQDVRGNETSRGDLLGYAYSPFDSTGSGLGASDRNESRATGSHDRQATDFPAPRHSGVITSPRNLRELLHRPFLPRSIRVLTWRRHSRRWDDVRALLYADVGASLRSVGGRCSCRDVFESQCIWLLLLAASLP